MLNKVYDKIKEYIKENKIFVSLIILILLCSYIELPYYINASGGLVNLDKKITIENEYQSEGSFNMAYVTEYKPSILMILYALINPDADIYKAEEYIMDNDTKEDMIYREKLQLQEAVDNAIILGYTNANKEVTINKVDLYVTYILNEANTDLIVGDKILKVNDIDIISRDQLNQIISEQELNEPFIVTVENNGEQYTRYATASIIEDRKIIGITITSDTDYTVSPSVNFKFKSNEAGPSGGLMTTLEIYDELTEEDITKGYKIVGTGTIEIDGTVGGIGGVKYKLKGAVKKHADIFLIPAGDNYEEAIKEKEENNYDIEIVSIGSFDEALNYLNNLDNK